MPTPARVDPVTLQLKLVLKVSQVKYLTLSCVYPLSDPGHAAVMPPGMLGDLYDLLDMPHCKVDMVLHLTHTHLLRPTSV